MTDRRPITLRLSVCVSAALLGATSPAWAGDLALNRPVSASSTERDLPHFAPARANDGDSATRWSSAYADNQWWQVDLGRDRTINRVELNWEVAYATKYRIQARRSRSNSWSTVANVSTGSAGWRAHTFSARSAQYVRITSDVRATPWGISLWDARVCDDNTCGGPPPTPTPTPTPTPAPPPTPTPSPSPGPAPTPMPDPNAPTLTAVDGGNGFYGRFSSPLPDAPGFFPMAVWGPYNLSVDNVQRYKDLGINVVDWVADPNNQAQLSNIRNAGMYAIHISEEQARWSEGAESVGYMLSDEIDMTCGPPSCDGYTRLRNVLAGLPRDGRARYNNWGKGIIFWQNDTNAQRWLNGDANGKFVDFSSVDIYWYSDAGVCSFSEGGRFFLGRDEILPQSQCRRSFNYGAVIDKMRRLDGLDGERQPIWNLVETGTPMTRGMTITPAQIRAAAWHSIIAGARGIVWFQHSFYTGGNGCGVNHMSLLDPCYAANADAVRGVGAQVKSLAPVLNAPTVSSHTQTSSGVRALYKWHDGHFYVLAGNRENVATTGTMGLPCAGNATAVKLGEDGEQIPVVRGTFMDEFENGDAIHIYRIDGGSSCGLAPG